MNSIHAEERRGDGRVSTLLVMVAIAIKYPQISTSGGLPVGSWMGGAGYQQLNT